MFCPLRFQAVSHVTQLSVYCKLFVLSPQRSPFIMERVGWLSLGRGVVHHLKLTPEQQLLEDASPS